MMANERSKRLRLNTASSLMLQLITAISGMILPKAILSAFGSEVNGLVSSITQFLGYIALMEAGFGGVARAALYKPLARGSNDEISAVLTESRIFFRRIAIILVAYVLLLAVVFPYLSSFSSFSREYVSSMVIILGIGSFVQYYFSVTYQLLLQADQRGYVANNVQCVSLILNVLAVISMIFAGFNIHMVKLVTAAVFIIKPLFFSYYINKNYKLNFKIKSKNNLKQKWDGMVHHLAFFIHQNTDITILTLFTNLKEVSVYSIYSAVTIGVRSIVSSVCSGAEAAIGNIQAEEDEDGLNSFVKRYELAMFFIGTIVFSVTLSMLPSFADVYTGKINDVNYYRKVFAIFLVLAEYMYAIRQPYGNVINSKGHFRETKISAITETLINLIVSILLVQRLGITGVAIGTFAAMSYRTIYNVWYLKKHIMHRSVIYFIKNLLLSIPNFICVYILYSFMEEYALKGLVNWFACAIIVTAFSLVLQSVIVFLTNKEIMIIVKRYIDKFREK